MQVVIEHELGRAKTYRSLRGARQLHVRDAVTGNPNASPLIVNEPQHGASADRRTDVVL